MCSTKILCLTQNLKLLYIYDNFGHYLNTIDFGSTRDFSVYVEIHGCTRINKIACSTKMLLSKWECSIWRPVFPTIGPHFCEPELFYSFRTFPTTYYIKAATTTLAPSYSSSDLIEVVEVISHPDFDAIVVDNNIALLKLASPFPSTSVAACLRAEEAPVGQLSCVVSGWGRTAESK